MHSWSCKAILLRCALGVCKHFMPGIPGLLMELASAYTAAISQWKTRVSSYSASPCLAEAQDTDSYFFLKTYFNSSMLPVHLLCVN